MNNKVRDRIFCHEKVVTEVKKLLPGRTELDFFGTKFYPMFPNGGRSVGWHQDSHYFGTKNCPEIISSAVYLEDTNVENGCLRVFPATHNKGIEYTHEAGEGKWKQGEWINTDKAFGEDTKGLDVIVPAGSVVLFDARLVHGAHENNSTDRSRFSFFAHYCPSSLDFEWRGTDFSKLTYKDRHDAGLKTT